MLLTSTAYSNLPPARDLVEACGNFANILAVHASELTIPRRYCASLSIWTRHYIIVLDARNNAAFDSLPIIMDPRPLISDSTPTLPFDKYS